MELWTFLADTDRLNRAIGLPAITFLPDDVKKGYHHASARYVGINVSYEEYPFEWVEGWYYRFERRFHLGIIKAITGGIRLGEVGGGTELEVYASIEPANVLTKIIARLALSKSGISDIVNNARAFESHYLSRNNTAAPALPAAETMHEAELDRRLALLRGEVAERLIQKFRDRVLSASDLEVVRMRPFDVADRWNEDRFEVLTFFLLASKAGVVDLHWTVLCPNCRGVSSDSLTLAELRSETHCDTCEITYGADLSESIEARFSVNPAVRDARADTYCIGGPANMPHIAAQFRLPPGGTRTERITLAPGIIRARSFQSPGILQWKVVPSRDALAEISVLCDAAGLSGDRSTIAAGDIQLTMSNTHASEALLIIERESWRDNAATAAAVTSMQAFKDLFPSESIAPGEEISISSIAILFTDLRSSTYLYKEVGDTKAFGFVQNHFRHLTESVARHHGGVVKTMGDAIMASFPSGSEAVEAAIEMQRSWNTFTRAYGDFSHIRLKIGVHYGSAIAINNRGRLDCFGATVNLAARLQKLSEGDDIIISDELYRNSAVASLLSNQQSLSVGHFTTELRGFGDDRFTVCRLTVA